MGILEQQLRARIGLDAATLGASMLERTVRRRMKAHRLTRVPDYRALLERSPNEWKELIESIVVAETWFFRDRESFAALTRLAPTRRRAGPPAAPLRLLSVPCSTGEEPYSLAMALLDAGWPRHRFHIDAVDISERALAIAKQAVYGRNSFRGPDLAFRARHFHAAKDAYALEPEVRECVNFSPGNLLEADFPAGAAPYDFIFCRNLLIYFNRPTQMRALHRLARLLHDQGFLFVGPAELPLVVNNGFVSTGLPLAFACRKSGAARGRARQNGELEMPAIERGASAVPCSAFPVPRPDDPLRTARRLADAGRLCEAAALCQCRLRQDGPSAQAYYLLGLIADAQGHASAAEFYRRAIYLEPNHCDALMQLSLLCARQGDAARARVLKGRAERAGSRRPPEE